MINEIAIITEKTRWIATDGTIKHWGEADAGQLLTSPFEITTYSSEEDWKNALSALGIEILAEASPDQESPQN